MELTVDQALQQGVAAHKEGKLQEAEKLYRAILGSQPQHPDANHNLGVLAVAIGKVAEALPLFKVALEASPQQVQFWLSYIDALMKVGQLDNARQVLQQGKASGLKGDKVDALEAQLVNAVSVPLSSGATRPSKEQIDGLVALYTQGKLEEALVQGHALAEQFPNDFIVPNILGAVYAGKGQHDEAVMYYNRVIDLKPDFAEVYSNLANAFNNLGKYEEAIAGYNKAIKLKPDFAGIYYNRGNVLNALDRYEEAIKSFNKAIELNPDYTEAHYNLGNALNKLEHYKEAIASFNKAIELKPGYTEAYNNLGVAFKEINQINSALESYKKALEINPEYAEAHNNLGLAFSNMGQIKESINSFRLALKLKPDYTFAYNNYGSALKQIGKFKDASECYIKALSIDAKFYEAHNNLGNVFKYLKRHDESLKSYERTYELNPDADYVLGNIALAKLHLCSWNELSNYLNEFPKKINNDEKIVDPFPLLAIIDNPELQQKSAEVYINHKFPENFDLPKISPYSGHDKIRIGYFSPDFRIHPVANLTAELYEIHNRDKFEVYAFSFGPDTKDEMNMRIKSGVDHFHDVRLMSHKEVALLSRSLEIDIAIDLGGFTQDTRTSIFAMRASPIQVNYLGYSGTMGAEYIDYLISDLTLIPEDKQQYYSEKIAYLPDSFMVNDTKNKVSTKEFTRKEAGLPDKGFVYSCFNHHYKITPAIFATWMKILSKVDGSVLWLSDGNNTGISNLKNEAKKSGIDSKRLIFAPRLDLREDHLNRIKLSNLFLDTLPYNAHATTSDALQVGLPVLTRIGESFASRVAASLINSVNLPELITETQQQYEELAIELAKDPKKLKLIKDKLKNNLPLSPLYDTPLYAKQLESAYQEMYERSQKKLEPDHIYV